MITDESGAAVPLVKVSARNVATNVNFASESDGAGYYRFASLPLSDFEVTAEHAGFGEVIQALHVDTAARVRLDFSLSVPPLPRRLR